MEKKGKIKEGHNWLIVSLSDDHSYVRIFNENDELIRLSKGETEIHHIADPGEYKVVTDGKIKNISSKFFELPKDRN